MIKNRIKEKKKTFLSLAFTLLVFLLAGLGLGRVSEDTKAQQKQNLEDAVRRNVVQCYIVEGAYPESLAYLEDHYPLLYDHDRFRIDYQPIGENMMPEITIVEKEG